MGIASLNAILRRGLFGVAGGIHRGQSPLLRPCFPVTVGADSVRDSAETPEAAGQGNAVSFICSTIGTNNCRMDWVLPPLGLSGLLSVST